jgi:hypothetical protein
MVFDAALLPFSDSIAGDLSKPNYFLPFNLRGGTYASI